MGVGENSPCKVDLAPHDHGQLRSAFGIDQCLPLPCRIGPPAPSAHVIQDLRHSECLQSAPCLARLRRTAGDALSPVETTFPVAIVATVNAFDSSRYSIVGSIAGSSDACLVTPPKHWGVAMKSPFEREWLDEHQ
jgi:hypothetical protein